MMTCPKCDGDFDGAATIRWGDGEQRLPVAPFICSWCASILIWYIKEQVLVRPEMVMEATGIDPIEMMRQNQTLWTAITESRKRILELPDRRPVLR